MRLIDADKLILYLNDYALQTAPFRGERAEAYNAIKQTSTARYETSCGYRLEEYFDTNACYCKQCGKKIKVVE